MKPRGEEEHRDREVLNSRCCASEQGVVCEEALGSAESATRRCTSPCSDRKRGFSSSPVLEGWMARGGLTLAWCFCVSPSEGEFRLPWEPAFVAPCLLCCRGAEQHTSERVCVSEDGGTSASSLTWVGIKGERGEWFRLPSCRCAWKLPAAAGLGEACSALDPWERLIRAQGGRR